MTDKHYIQQTEHQRLRSWVLSQMLSGAGWAALCLFVLGVALYALYGLSLLLPAESKQAPSPQQTSALEMPLGDTRTA